MKNNFPFEGSILLDDVQEDWFVLTYFLSPYPSLIFFTRLIHTFIHNTIYHIFKTSII